MAGSAAIGGVAVTVERCYADLRIPLYGVWRAVRGSGPLCRKNA